MAKKVTAVVKLQLPAGKATPGPPVGSTLGPHGINIPQFTKDFNDKTKDKEGLVIPVVIRSLFMAENNIFHLRRNKMCHACCHTIG